MLIVPCRSSTSEPSFIFVAWSVVEVSLCDECSMGMSAY